MPRGAGRSTAAAGAVRTHHRVAAALGSAMAAALGSAIAPPSPGRTIRAATPLRRAASASRWL